MESVAHDEICLDDITWDDDLSIEIDLEPDMDVSHILFEDPDGEIDLEPDGDLSHITFEDAGERMRRETEEYLAATTGVLVGRVPL